MAYVVIEGMIVSYPARAGCYVIGAGVQLYIGILTLKSLNGTLVVD